MTVCFRNPPAVPTAFFKTEKGVGMERFWKVLVMRSGWVGSRRNKLKRLTSVSTPLLVRIGHNGVASVETKHNNDVNENETNAKAEARSDVTNKELAEGTYYYKCRVFEKRVTGIEEQADILRGEIQLLR